MLMRLQCMNAFLCRVLLTRNAFSLFPSRPVENKKKSQKGVYVCPLYLYPVRTGTRERPSFMINVDLKAGAADPDHWVMRGTALLLALAS